MKKIVILGPESTGKSTLVSELAFHFKACHVNEYARDYLNKIKREYCEEDLVEIALGQIKLEERIEKQCSEEKRDIIFYDTDITVLKIWSEYKFGKCNPWILNQYRRRSYDLYLLTFPDLEWKPDPLRESPNELKTIFGFYLQDLQKRDLNYKVISGNGLERTAMAVNAVSEFVS